MEHRRLLSSRSIRILWPIHPPTPNSCSLIFFLPLPAEKDGGRERERRCLMQGRVDDACLHRLSIRHTHRDTWHPAKGLKLNRIRRRSTRNQPLNSGFKEKDDWLSIRRKDASLMFGADISGLIMRRWKWVGVCHYPRMSRIQRTGKD